MHGRGTIVVGYDDGEAAGRALERAIDEARSTHARLVVLSVLELPLDPQAPRNFGTLDDGPATGLPAGAPPELQRLLERAREQVEPAGVRADYLCAAGDPAETIVEVAREERASLVVLGSHHHGLLGRLLGPDVATEVERSLGAGVLLVE